MGMMKVLGPLLKGALADHLGIQSGGFCLVFFRSLKDKNYFISYCFTGASSVLSGFSLSMNPVPCVFWEKQVIDPEPYYLLMLII